ncbi:MAG: L,D-transpeptidase family protein [Steroidobacteraceae bacterium]
MKSVPVRIALVACASLTVGACALLRPPPRFAPAAPRKAAPAQPAAPLPSQTERFVLAPRQDVVGHLQIVEVRKDQTLSDIGRLFNVGFKEMTRANPGVDPWIPKPGTRVVVPTQYILPDAPRRGIVVNLAAMRLFYFPRHERGQPQVVITHPVGIGRRGWKTPQGVTHVLWHEKNPVWHVPPSILAEHAKEGEPLPKVVGPGPDNPLGNYALHLGWPGYLIHGTNKPVSVGLRVSHGCVHLFPEDIAQIFKMVPNGTEVRVVNQPYVFGWRDGRLYLQSSGPLQDDKRAWKNRPRRMLARMLTRAQRKQLERHHEKIDWSRVAQLVDSPAGVPVPVSAGGAGIDQGLAHGGGDVLPQVIAQAALVQNTLPVGSTWDGKTDLPLTNAELEQTLSETAAPATKPGAPPAPAANPSGT